MKSLKQKLCGLVSTIVICSLSAAQFTDSDFIQTSAQPNEQIKSANVSEMKILKSEMPFEDNIENNKSEHEKGYILLSSFYVNVYNMPCSENAPIDKIETSLCVSIAESTEQWYKIMYETNKSGYVLKKDITFDKEKADFALCEITEQKQNEIVQNETENITSSYTAPELNPKAEEIINTAKKYLGTKYVYGGTSPAGFDCSGLVKYVFNSVGINVNRTAAAQFNNGKAVNKKDLMPGDLLFFAKNGRIHHVGIYAGNGEMIHAPQTGDVVKYSSINTPYRQNEFVGARRVY